jgi:HEPN domain-containing protein
MSDERAEAVRDLVAEWLRRARADLAVASMVEDDRISSEILVFHAQQAAEKALKALLVQRQSEFPHTHVIGLLLNLCQAAGYEGIEDIAEATTLTRYAVAARYPEAEEMISRQEAEAAAALAAKVLDWVEARLNLQV